jgi:hypothetical protein
MNPSFIKPRYDESGFAGIPDRITNAFASGKYDAVVLFLVDAFGWRFFERFQDAAFIQRIAKHGRLEKLISPFPSPTAAHVTTIHTVCLLVRGVSWWYYGHVDASSPLLFSYSGTRTGYAVHKGQAFALYPQGFLSVLKKMGGNLMSQDTITRLHIPM